MANLTGNLKDVTNQAPSTVVSITVKAPGVRLGTGNDLIVSSPAEVDFNRDTGELILTDITNGLSWLVIEGTGWTDTLSLSVAVGMTTLVEAVANAVGVPGMVDYVKLTAALTGALDEIAQDAVDALAQDAVNLAVETIKWDRGVVGHSVESLDQLSPGAWGIASTTVANNLGLPFTQGTLQVSRISSGKTVVGVANEAGSQSLGLWVTSISGGGVVAPWKRIDIGADSVGAPGLKSVGVALTSGSTLDGDAGRYRILAQVTAPVTRWRVHFECRRMIYSTTRDFTLGTVQVGDHTGNGAIANVQTLKSGDTLVSGNGEWVSKWIDRDLDEEVLIDFQASGNSLMTFQAPAFKLDGSTWQTSNTTPLAVWIEVETYQQTPVVAMIGDSTGAGVGADRPVHDSALHIAARKHEFIPMNYSYPGSGLNTMADGDLHIYKRWEHLAKPDSVVIQAGSNNIHGGVSLSEIQGYLEDVVTMAREKISPVVLGSTVKARYPDSGTHQDMLNAYNAFVETQPPGTRGYLDFYQAVTPNGSTSSADAADAAHLSTSGHAKGAVAFDSVDVARPAWVDAVDKADFDAALDTKADKSYVDEVQWKKSNVKSADTLDSLPEGTYEVNNGAISTGLGIPYGVLGSITIHNVGKSRVASYITNHATRPREYINSRVSGVWSGWSRFASAEDLDPLATKEYVDDSLAGISPSDPPAPAINMALLGAPVTPWESAGIVTNYAQGELYLEQVTTQISNVQRVKIGSTHLGKDITALVVGDTSKPVVMLEGGIHGNEVAPREALFIWARKAAQYRTWMDDICLVIIPTVNGDRTGHNRENAQSVDINRSFGDASTSESQAVISAFDTYQPVFYLSCHEFEHTNSENEIETGNSDFEGLAENIRTESVRVESAIWQAVQALGASVGSYPASQIPGPGEPITTARTWVSVVKNTPAVLIETGGGLYPKTYANHIGVHPARYNPPLDRRVELYLASLDAALGEVGAIISEKSV